MTVTTLTHDSTRSRTTTGLAYAVASATTFGLSGALARGLLDTGWRRAFSLALGLSSSAA